MEKVFRFRPANDFTIEEIKNEYLWFSRPTEFNDNMDSNIIGFAENNEGIKQAFNRVFGDYNFIGEYVSYTGICCFTETSPRDIDWIRFPKGHNGVFIEYHKSLIENSILNYFSVGDCFKKVDYVPNPSIFDSSSDSNDDILWEENNGIKCYKSLRGDIERNQRNMEIFLIKLFTRISDRFIAQNEVRIILGKKKFNNSDVVGYRVSIDRDCVKAIYYNKYTSESFINNLKKIINNNIPLIKIDDL